MLDPDKEMSEISEQASVLRSQAFNAVLRMRNDPTAARYENAIVDLREIRQRLSALAIKAADTIRAIERIQGNH